MKQKLKPTLAAACVFAMLFVFVPATSAQSINIPIVLMQELQQPVGSVHVRGMHDVTVCPDTMDYIAVVTSCTAEQAMNTDSLQQPLKTMKLTGNALLVPTDFPYVGGISIHTTARKLEVVADDDSRVWLTGEDDTLRFEFLNLEARGHSTLLVQRPVVVDQMVLNGRDFATLRHRSIDCRDMTRIARDESRVEQMGVDDQEEAFSFRVPQRIHMLFGGWSFGISGWSQAPFGGMAVPMDDYTMNTTLLGFFDIRLGWNALRRGHWDFGVGVSLTTEGFMFPRLMGVVADSTTGLSHFGPAEEPAYYSHPSFAGQTRTWRSSVGSMIIGLPLRTEWHRRLDYRGLRISAELKPALQIGSILRSHGTWTTADTITGAVRNDYLTDTIVSLYNLFRCDLRVDIGWNNLSLFASGSLTPLFRTARKDGHPCLDTKIYPLSIGISINY